MLFRKKSKVAAAPAPVAAPVAVSGEPDMRGLGRVLWAKKAKILGVTLSGRCRRLCRRQRDDAALPLRIAAAAGGARERVPARRGRQERRRPQHDRSRGGDQPDPARAVARSGARGDQERQARRTAGIRSGAQRRSLLQIGARPVRHRPRSQHDDAGRAHARSLLRPAQRLCGGKVARDRRRFRFGQSRSRRPRRQHGRRDLSQDAADRRSRTRPAPPATGWPARSTSMRTKVADAEAKVEDYRAKSNLFVGSNNTSLPSQQLTEINSQISAARGQKADLEARARQLRDAHPLRQADRVLRHRQFRIDAPADRAAHRAALAARRAIVHACSTSIRASRNCGRRSPNSSARCAPKASAWRASSTTTPRSPATGWRR